MTITFLPNKTNHPPGKLADAELYFTGGALEGLKLVGFGIWERRDGTGRNVTMPSRQFAVNAELRSFALLRPTGEGDGPDAIRHMILEAFASYEQSSSIAGESSA